MPSKWGRKTRILALLILLLSTSVSYNACSPDFVVLNLQSALSSASISDLAAGANLYTQTCSGCHGALASSTKLNRSAMQIIMATSSVPQMAGLTGLSQDQFAQIASALGDPATAIGAINTLSVPHTCANPGARGASEIGMRRLNNAELTNTLSDIFGSDVVGAVPSLNNMPADGFVNSVTEINSLHSSDQVRAWADVALDLAGVVAQDNGLLSRVAPACVTANINTTLTDACVLSFIDQLGPVVYRRPLPSSDRSALLATYKDPSISSLPTEQKIELVIAQMLSSPQMVFIWLDTDPVATGVRSRVDAYTVANRLAYELTGSMPDSTLMAKATDGTIMGINVLKSEARRLIETDRGRERVWTFAYLWTGAGNTKQPTQNAAARVGAPSDLSTSFWIYAYAMQETKDYFNYIVYNKGGNFTDLMTSHSSFPRYAPLAKAMGTGVWSDGADPIVTPNRAGIASRPAFLFNNGDRESPIKRGVALRTKILCETVPPPPASLDSAIGSATASFDQSLFSSRDVAGKITGSGSCIGCHSSLNPLGYTLGNFGPIGEYRTTETTYKDDGTVAGSFVINSSAGSLNVVNANDSANGLDDLNQLLAKSVKAKVCFAENAFRSSRYRLEQASDSCQLADVEQLLISGASLKDALLAIATSEDIYWRGY